MTIALVTRVAMQTQDHALSAKEATHWKMESARLEVFASARAVLGDLMFSNSLGLAIGCLMKPLSAGMGVRGHKACAKAATLSLSLETMCQIALGLPSNATSKFVQVRRRK